MDLIKKNHLDNNTGMYVLHAHATPRNCGDAVIVDTVKEIFAEHDCKVIHYSPLPPNHAGNYDFYVDQFDHAVHYVNSCKAIIIGGGDVLLGEYDRYLRLIMHGTARRIPVYVLGVGVNFSRSQFGCLPILAFFLNRCCKIVVRERASALRLKNIGVREDLILESVDLGFALHALRHPIMSNRNTNTIALSVRAPEYNSLYWDKELYQKIAVVLDHLHEKYRCTFKFLVLFALKDQQAHNDRAVAHSIGSFMRNKDCMTVCNAQNYSDALSVLADSSYAICMRLHSMILSATTNTPFVALTYSPKTNAFIEELGLQEYALAANSVSVDDLMKRIDLLRGNYQILVEQIDTWVKQAYKRADIYRDIAAIIAKDTIKKSRPWHKLYARILDMCYELAR